MLNEGTLVLEGVTLGEVVQLVVEVLVDLAGGTVLDQKAAEDTETAHPEDLAVVPCQQLFHVYLLTALCYVVSFISRAVALSVLHTWAYERRQYPSSYRNHGDGRCGGRRSAHGHGRASAW